jgi:hypothetical protein
MIEAALGGRRSGAVRLTAQNAPAIASAYVCFDGNPARPYSVRFWHPEAVLSIEADYESHPVRRKVLLAVPFSLKDVGAF